MMTVPNACEFVIYCNIAHYTYDLYPLIIIIIVSRARRS